MKINTILGVLLCFLISFSCKAQSEKSYIFFLHQRFLEYNSLEEVDPKYGKSEYPEILQAFEKAGFEVISEKRKGDVNAREYAVKVVKQIDSLLAMGVASNSITVIGTSKGGYIAQYVSTLAANPELNFVFIGSYTDSDIENIPQINFCGNILTIYEKSDEFGVSAFRRKETSKLRINHFKEVELNTGLGHGFLYKAMPEWIAPSVQWARQNYY